MGQVGDIFRQREEQVQRPWGSRVSAKACRLEEAQTMALQSVWDRVGSVAGQRGRARPVELARPQK